MQMFPHCPQSQKAEKNLPPLPTCLKTPPQLPPHPAQALRSANLRF